MAKRDAAWNEFSDWCRRRRLRPLPAHPWTLAAFVRWCEPRHRYPAIADRVRAVARVHVLNGLPPPDRHPTVTRTLGVVEHRLAARPQRSALFPSPDETSTRHPAAAPDTRPRRAKRRWTASMRSEPRLVSRRPASS